MRLYRSTFYIYYYNWVAAETSPRLTTAARSPTERVAAETRPKRTTVAWSST